jgi:hypothetical protein
VCGPSVEAQPCDRVRSACERGGRSCGAASVRRPRASL